MLYAHHGKLHAELAADPTLRKDARYYPESYKQFESSAEWANGEITVPLVASVDGFTDSSARCVSFRKSNERIVKSVLFVKGMDDGMQHVYGTVN